MDKTIAVTEGTDLLAERIVERQRMIRLQRDVSRLLGRLDYRVSDGAAGIPPAALASLTEIRDQLSAALDASMGTAYVPRMDPPPPRRVRVRFRGPDGAVLGQRVADDDWYPLGGHKPTKQERQQERERTAGAELREWLAGGTYSAGTYTLTVVKLDDEGAETDTVWACVKTEHPPGHTKAAPTPSR